MAFTFTKEERLCSKIYITKLFEKGNPKVNGFPFRFSWAYENLESKYPVQVVFIVSKKKFAKAHQRIRIKRQLRELYRLQKHQLYQLLQSKNQRIILALSYVGETQLSGAELKPLFHHAFNKLLHEMAKHH